MEIISNKKLLDKYIEKYEIDKIFSFWDKYECKLVKFPKGEIISSKNKKLNELLFVVEGCLKIYYISSDGNALSLAFKEGFTMLGDMEFAGEKTCPYAESVSEVLCISISMDRYKDLLNEDIKFCRYVIKSLAKKVSNSSKNSFLNQLHSKESRLALYILANEDNKIKRSWTEVSHLLAFSYRQLMRLLSKFCEDGLIKRVDKKGQYIIVDRKKLESLCEDLSW